MEDEKVMVPVTVIEQRGSDACLVEYQVGALKRAVVPNAMIADGQVEAGDLALGIPYGLPWESMLTLSTSAEVLAEELRERGIWTIEDMRRDQPAVFGALQAAYGLDLAALIRAAENYVKGR